VLFDTHVHLGDDRFALDRAEVLQRAAARGVFFLVEIADSPAQWSGAVALSRAYPARVRCALGLHPYHASDCTEEILRVLGRAILQPEVVAVGEIGLDYARGEISRPVQRAACERLLASCRCWDKPAVIHCRNAYEDLRGILRNIFPSPPAQNRFWGVVHCFSGDVEDAQALAAMGFALGADGPITYPKNDSLRDAFLRVGISRMVLETDSPYLPTQDRRGQRNEPAAVATIAEAAARIFKITPEEAGRITTENACLLFRMARPENTGAGF
jgi:TatD DNase family protein